MATTRKAATTSTKAATPRATKATKATTSNWYPLNEPATYAAELAAAFPTLEQAAAELAAYTAPGVSEAYKAATLEALAALFPAPASTAPATPRTYTAHPAEVPAARAMLKALAATGKTPEELRAYAEAALAEAEGNTEAEQAAETLLALLTAPATTRTSNTATPGTGRAPHYARNENGQPITKAGATFATRPTFGPNTALFINSLAAMQKRHARGLRAQRVALAAALAEANGGFFTRAALAEACLANGIAESLNTLNEWFEVGAISFAPASAETKAA